MAGILFPHSHIPESLINGMIHFFKNVRLFLPWYMEPSGSIKDKPIKILNPPESLKPKEDFKYLVSEYQLWMRKNRDRSYIETIKSARDREPTPDRTWEIRNLLRNRVKSAEGTSEENIIKWHLILHLAREIEEQHITVDGILMTLKKKDSLLKGSIENPDETKSLLEDLRPFEDEPLPDDRGLERIYGAWIGLFGEYLRSDEPLITINRRIMSDISERWDRFFIKDDSGYDRSVDLTLPELSHLSSARQAKIRSEYPVDKVFTEIMTLISGLPKNPARNLKELEKVSDDFNNSFPWELSEEAFGISLKHLNPPPDNGLAQRGNVLMKLSNKTLIYMETRNIHG